MDKLNKVVIPEGFKATKIRVENDCLLYEIEAIEKSIKEQVNDWINDKNTVKYWISPYSNINTYQNELTGYGDNKNILPSKEHCEQILALQQLILACWVTNGCKKLELSETKAYICKNKIDDDIIVIYNDGKRKYLLNFLSFTIAKQFCSEFKELIETAKPLL